MIEEFIPYIAIPSNITSYYKIINFKILFSHIFKCEQKLLNLFCHVLPVFIERKYASKEYTIDNITDSIMSEIILWTINIGLYINSWDCNLCTMNYNGIVICSTNTSLICYLLIKKIIFKCFMNMNMNLMGFKFLKYYSLLINHLLIILFFLSIKEIIINIKQKKKIIHNF